MAPVTGFTDTTGMLKAQPKNDSGFASTQNPFNSLQENSLFGGMPQMPVNTGALENIGDMAMMGVLGGNNMNIMGFAAGLLDTLDKIKPTQEQLEQFASLYSFMDLTTGSGDFSTTQTGGKKARRQKLSPECRQAIREMAERLKMPAEAIEAVIYSESGGDPSAVNPSNGASGLIQFIDSRAKQFGTTLDALRNMSALEQMPFIEKYFTATKRAAGYSKNDVIDSKTVYALVYLPGRAKNEVLCHEGEKYYHARLDLDKNGKVEKSELEKRMIKLGGLKA